MEAILALMVAGIAAAFGIIGAGIAVWSINRQMDLERKLEWAERQADKTHEAYSGMRALLDGYSNAHLKDIAKICKKFDKMDGRLQMVEKLNELEPGMYVPQYDPQTKKTSMVRAQNLEDTALGSAPVDGYDAIDLGIKQLTKAFS